MVHTTHYFLGANGGEGFCNLFDQLTKEPTLVDLMILKGGPGAGKSTFMQKIGAAAEGRGLDVEYIHCSGAPDSLDGVWIPALGKAAVDGTAPHVIEPRYPAAVDRVVDMGRFYRLEELKEKREAIIGCTDKCQAMTEAAGHYLKAFGALEKEERSLILPALDGEKLLRRAEGILRRELRGTGAGQSGRTTYRFLGGVTGAGMVWRMDTVQTLCSRIYVLHDSYGCGEGMLRRIQGAALAAGYDVTACLCPWEPSRLEHVLIPQLELGFVTVNDRCAFSGEAFRHLRLDAAAEEPYRCSKGRLRFLRRMKSTLLDEAVLALRGAGNCHDRLEKLYHPHVDFDGVSVLTEQELARL